MQEGGGDRELPCIGPEGVTKVTDVEAPGVAKDLSGPREAEEELKH